jgi:hypothetical protein
VAFSVSMDEVWYAKAVRLRVGLKNDDARRLYERSGAAP